MRKEVYGEGAAHPDIAGSLHQLGSVYYRESNYEKAREYYEESLRIRKEVYGEGAAHSDIASSLHQLGSVYRRRELRAYRLFRRHKHGAPVGRRGRGERRELEAEAMAEEVVDPAGTLYRYAVPKSTLFRKLG